jgi:hypothetical protein
MPSPRRKTRGKLLIGFFWGLCALTPLGRSATAPIDEESPWPRIRSTNGTTVTLHLPEVESWTSNSFRARAAVEVKLAKTKTDLLGVVWFEAHGTVDHSNRLVTLDTIEITKPRFTDAKASESNALSAVRDVLPSGARTVSLDYLVVTLGFARAAGRQGVHGLKHDAPNIIWSTNRAVLILIDGNPILRPISGSSFQRVINTPALLVTDPSNRKFYLAGEGRWFSADAISGPWSAVQVLPADLAALSKDPAQHPPLPQTEDNPRIVVSTSPAELLMTRGLPVFNSIKGTRLQYASNSDSQLFFDSTQRDVYLLLSGRWFKAKSLHGPWNYVAPHDLPSEFAKIPRGTPQALVLASVPDTPEAELAIIANSVPSLATFNRREAVIQLSYDGEPKFQSIEGTAMRYAVNAQLPVIHCENKYFALDNGVWFLAPSPTGPWEVAMEVPEEIYTIPPSSPVYYATFAEVYHSSDDEVEAGYTPGYTGAYEDDGTMVYGTGWEYQPWSGDDYYGWGWTWGYNYVYVPWYQWWVWRPWWYEAGGLRSAVIENIYDRWQGRNGISHYDSLSSSSSRAGSAERAPSADRAPSAPRAPSAGSAPTAEGAGSAERAGSAARAGSAERAPSAERASSDIPGYPALYGRFKGTREAVAMAPPANTLALNPYSRPKSSVRPGEIPTGAQLLTSIQQTPGAGRELYASPDGNIYRRNNDGWYRREAGGGWSYIAPTEARIGQERPTAERGGRSVSGSGTAYRPIADASNPGGRQGLRGDVPSSESVARRQEVATLERQYYARALAQMRSQNWRGANNFSRPNRASRGRR